ncbi:MAG TPA: pantetheine-phosphate adenylyltransferase [Stellaceae bacterium]|nr:pantetheine-phosphate adenylyltransferase [Stellaceae bacterium]
MSKERVGFYPGTFDPITNGHTDIILRATKIVDRLVVGVARNIGKGPLFSTEERLEIVREEIAHIGDAATRDRVEVKAYDTLTMHFAVEQGASIIVRGLRAVSDFEYEFQMAGMNNRLNANVETVFLMANDKYQFIASRFVKEIAQLGGDVTPFVSARVATHIARRIGRENGKRAAKR